MLPELQAEWCKERVEPGGAALELETPSRGNSLRWKQI